MGKLVENRKDVILDGPICNGSRVIGWHTHHVPKGIRRFHADMSGFAFNSTILWDPKRWHRPTLEPIRLIHTVNDDFQVSCLSCLCFHCRREKNHNKFSLFESLFEFTLQVSSFIEQVVEDESQMEGFPLQCSRILAWHLDVAPFYSSGKNISLQVGPIP